MRKVIAFPFALIALVLGETAFAQDLAIGPHGEYRLGIGKPNMSVDLHGKKHGKKHAYYNKKMKIGGGDKVLAAPPPSKPKPQ